MFPRYASVRLVLAAGVTLAAGGCGAKADKWLTHDDASNHFALQYPSKWGIKTGRWAVMHYVDAFVSLNNLGKPDMQVMPQEVPEGHSEYSDRVVAGQLPPGCVYLEFGQADCPGGIQRWGPGVTELEAGNVVGLLGEAPEKPSREPGLTKREFSLHKWGQLWYVRVYFREPVSEEDRRLADRILRSIRFDAIPVGDRYWAIGEARKHLPPEADPDEYRQEGGNIHRHCRAERRGDDVTVEFKKRDPGPPEGPEMVWRFRVTAKGEVVRLDEQ